MTRTSAGEPTATGPASAHRTAAPDVATPDVAAPGVAAPDVAAPGVASPDVATPDVAAPGVDAAGRRNLTDAKEIRALAHPVRIALLEALRREGTLTATEAGDLLDESPANCSFHLRTLAKYGYVEEAPGGTGRQRPWRRASRGLSFTLDNPQPEVTAAAEELDRQFRQRDEHERERWESSWRSYPKPWREASFSFRGVVYLTPDELREVNAAILAVIDGFEERTEDRSQRPAGAFPVSISAGGFPLPLTKHGN
ncbi:winged helix-turn-helix domain-containing protein [Nakamurella lactea]|uniref:winged helix-turn-helix domain-containing protein n=1 Tax=Nakamurella lactea TaxID=459515 RepID=UPI00042984EC|nr:helix-turn-helix domain-containing protein [Nakamurella lactea]